MNVDKLTLAKIFDPTGRLEAPLFQRPYVWTREDNWEPLWESIASIAEKRVANVPARPHFLGTIVLDQLKTPTGSVAARQIIDGQQRLTTLQVVLAVARDLCTIGGIERYAKAFARLIDNDTPLSDQADDVFKVWPTNADQAQFRAVMKAGSPDAVRKINGSVDADDSLIPTSYLYFSEVISTWLGVLQDPMFLSRVAALYQTLHDDLNLVVIDLDAQDDAQLIFETLNALGTPLLPADLVKNLLFHAAATAKQDTQALYRRYWETFDESKSYWRKEVKQGRLRRPVIDSFLQHYLTLLTGEETSAAQLFSTFREIVRAGTLEPAQHMAEFRAYADIYRGFEGDPNGSRKGVFFYRLEELDTATMDPLLLEVFRRESRQPNSHMVDPVLQDLESFFVRRAVCELPTKSYNRFFAEMIKKLRVAGDFSGPAIRALLLEQTAETSRWPDDQEFEQAWNSIAFYKRLKAAKTRMILEALNTALQVPKAEPLTIEGKLTIEHLMPQDWKKHWPLDPDHPSDEAEDLRNQALQRVGNLTLLTKSLNPAISNGPWDRKKKEILKHSALNLNRELPDAWSEVAIAERTTQLFSAALRTWPRLSKTT